MEELIQELENLNFKTSAIYEGIIAKDTWYGWRKRGLPKAVKKYFQILDRLEHLKKPKQSEWTASDNH